MDCQEFLNTCCALDLECDKQGNIFAIAASYQQKSWVRQSIRNDTSVFVELKAFVKTVDCLLGHNLIRHDLPLIDAATGTIDFLAKPVVDTLYLSPLAFPENPYHKLIKDYKLVRDGLNDPLLDAKLALQLFQDQWRVLSEAGDLISYYRFAFSGESAYQGLQQLFDILGAESLVLDQANDVFIRESDNRVCKQAVKSLLSQERVQHQPALAYCLAWLRVAGGNSVLPPWVRLQFPEIPGIITRLREIPCHDEHCNYCRETHNPTRQLSRFFGFESFRSQPENEHGDSLQQDIVQAAMQDQPLFAVLPTGGGKSLCFQLPALVRHQRRGALTIIISPLQALMKDQVDNLANKTGSPAAAALNGLLTMPERGAVLKAVQLGDIALLYISPEQLRNHSFQKTIEYREIGCWVFDEAHCLSKWGHDFRPDYLFAARYIKEQAIKQKGSIAPIQCFTATAKQDVKDEIREYFNSHLGMQLNCFEGGVERDNLQFAVQTVNQSDKLGRIHSLLSERLPADKQQGSAIIYCATRKNTELVADYLKQQGWQVEAFHAGKNAAEKKHIQDSFINNHTRIITATNAFGMGIDKDDVRLVIHADIPGSLENYLQEAGRAGRDRKDAECVLLYDEQDIETQFKLSAASQLSQRDIAQLLKGLRNSKKNQEGSVVLTSGELLQHHKVNTSFDENDRNASTKVITAVAWLEKSGYVERNENRTQVFQGRPLVKDLQQAKQKLTQLKLSQRQQQRWLAILEMLFNAESDQGFSADELAQASEFDSGDEQPENNTETPAQRVIRTLYDMTAAGLIEKNLLLTAFVRYKGAQASDKTLIQLSDLERGMLQLMQEQLPEFDDQAWLSLSLRHLNQHLLDQGFKASNPEILRKLLNSLSYDGLGLAGNKGSMTLRHKGQDHYAVKLLRDWPALITTAERRQAVTQAVLQQLLTKIPPGTKAGNDLLIEFSLEELMAAVQGDMQLAAQVKDPLAAVERALNFMHEQQIITLQNGLAVFRQAMTIKVLPEAKQRRYNKGDFQPLAQHYSERIFQVHVMNAYAQQALEKIGQALAFVLAYFAEDKKAFVERYFSDQKEIYQRATSQQSFQRIVTDLQNPEQIALVAAAQSRNNLILAGPGSGKTKVIIHRCAYLLRVKRMVPDSMLILCFNRSAATELKTRLYHLIGEDSRGVTIQTYHGFSLQLTGHTLDSKKTGPEFNFDSIIQEAIDLLNGKTSLLGLPADQARDRLLSGYQTILVDEYQDIDALQYQLVAAIAGKQQEQDQQLQIIAVGDDDQNIYQFRGANTLFIKQFEQDYQARTHYLVENYRSSHHIISAANQLIAANHDRMKTGYPIRINKARKALPPGGRWQQLDPSTQGRVKITECQSIALQAVACIDEFLRLRQLDNRLAWTDCTILAREWQVLSTVRTVLDERQIPYYLALNASQLPPPYRVREHAELLETIKQHPETLHTAGYWLEFTRQQLSQYPENSWWQGLQQLLKDWETETGAVEIPDFQTLDYLYQSLAEQRRTGQYQLGIRLSTVHAAKGTEFAHVAILDGGWQHGEQEEQRRLYYVAMTRAKETLHLLSLKNPANPFIQYLTDAAIVSQAQTENCLNPLPLIQYENLTLQDIQLSYAANFPEQHPIHVQLQNLQPGHTLTMQQKQEKLFLLSGTIPVASLSKKATPIWLLRQSKIISITVIAMIRRYREDSEEQYHDQCRVEQWEVPMVEIKYLK